MLPPSLFTLNLPVSAQPNSRRRLYGVFSFIFSNLPPLPKGINAINVLATQHEYTRLTYRPIYHNLMRSLGL